MKYFGKKILSFFVFLSIFAGNIMADNNKKSQNMSSNDSGSTSQCMLLELKYGEVKIKLRSDLAPNTVSRIIELTNQGFYNGVPFHRVISGFMAQTGDPTGTGMGGSGKKLKAEFNKEPHVRGTVSMARAASPDSADSQFFIVYAPSHFLDGQYTVFGQVESGMEYVDLIKKGDKSDNGSVTDPDKIISARITDCQ